MCTWYSDIYEIIQFQLQTDDKSQEGSPFVIEISESFPANSATRAMVVAPQ